MSRAYQVLLEWEPDEQAWVTYVPALEHLELVISYENPERIAAVLLEPVVGSNGVIVYPEDYLRGVREVCDRHGILFIADEVMTGFGRYNVAAALTAKQSEVDEGLAALDGALSSLAVTA